MTEYVKDMLAKYDALGVEIARSPDDGGWRAVVIAKTGANLHTTESHGSVDAAWSAARAWCEEHQPNKRLMRLA